MREKLIDLLDDIQLRGEDFTDYEIYGMRLPNTVSNDDVADHLIANDVVPVVRCKDCKYMEVTPDSLRWCYVWNGINGMGDDGFCNYGERIDDDST